MPAGNKLKGTARIPHAGRPPRTTEPSLMESHLASLLALKEQLEDIIETWIATSPATGAGRAAGGPPAGSSTGPRLGLVVGHTARAPGGSGLGAAGPSEYPWNKDLAEQIKTAGAKLGIEVGIFLRDGSGVAGAYRALANWGATAAIELHYNNHDGNVRGTETLWGTACPTSKAWATAVQAAMVALFGRSGKHNRGLKQAPPYDRGRSSVNALSTIPSCLIEPFFGDHPDDAALGSANKSRLAETIVSVFVSRFAGAAPPPAKPAASRPGYAPPISAAKYLHNLNLTPAKPFAPGEQIKGLKELRILAGNVVFLDTDLATDADGSPRANEIDPYGHLATAYNFPGQTGQACFPDAEKIPYLVLPGCNQPAKRPRENYLYRRLGLQLGDLAAVIWRDRIEFAMFADVGANDQIGEGSIALVESLGWNPWNANKTRIVSGIPGPGVLTFVFPNSRIPGITPQNAAAEIRRAGAECFKAIGGTLIGLS